MMSGINRLFAAALLLCLVFTGCGAKETAAVPTPEGLVVNGLYTGFDAIPAGYAAKQAEADGTCVSFEDAYMSMLRSTTKYLCDYRIILSL